MDLLGHVPGHQGGLYVGNLLLLHDHPDLPPGLNGVGLLHPLEGDGDPLQVLQPLDILLERFPARPRPGRGKGVRRGHQDRLGTDRLHVPVMGGDRVHHIGGLPEFPGKIPADHRVPPLLLVVDRLADVMEERGPLAEGHVQAQLRPHDRAHVSHLPGVEEIVLAVTGPILQPSQEPDNLRMDVADPQVEQGLLRVLLHPLFEFLANLLHHLLDPGGMDPAVRDQALQGLPGHLPADRIESGNDHGLRSVVHDEIHPRGRFQRPDIPSFPADDPPLQLVAGEMDHGDGALGHVVVGVPLDGQGDDLPGLLFGRGLGLILQPLDLLGRLEPGLGLHHLHDLLLGLLRGNPRQTLQNLPLLPEVLFILGPQSLHRLFPGRQFLLAAPHLGLPPVGLLPPPVQLVVPGVELPFQVHQLRPFVLGLLLDLLTPLIENLLGF